MIIVFTKIDRLHFHEKSRLTDEYMEQGMEYPIAREKAQKDYVTSAEEKYNRSCVEVFQSDSVLKGWANYCAVSYKCLWKVLIFSSSLAD